MALSPETPPYALMGGETAVQTLVARFYEHMALHEPALARLHACEPDGRVTAEAQERFCLFLIGWLGGPQTYMQVHGHPRLRMRHAHVPVDSAMRDAWLRSMNAAIAEGAFEPEVVAHLQRAFAQVADFLRNRPDGAP